MIAEKKFSYAKIINALEYQLLTPGITEKDTINGCKLAMSLHIPVICVKPCYVHQTISVLRGSNVAAATVVGYPYGDAATSIKVAETKLALTEGVLELNLVANPTYLIDGNNDLFKRDLDSICCLARMNGALLNVILNCQFLPDDLIIEAAKFSANIGAAWISPSSGVEKVDSEVYLSMLKPLVGENCQLKTMGSVDNFCDFLKMYELGCTRIGTSELQALLDSIEL